MSEDGGPDLSEPVASAPDEPDWVPPEFNTGVAHSARVYDYWLGGCFL
jgi:hypothetical protein